MDFPRGQPWLWVAGIIGVLLTGLYTFRLIFLVFFGTSHTPVTRRRNIESLCRLSCLAVLSIVGGWFKNSLVAFLNHRVAAARRIPAQRFD